jgi:hypothetical protein
MTLEEISNIRLISQQIAAAKSDTAKEIVNWMGAMQAQDYAMSKWALGVRLPNTTDQIVENAIDNAEIIRTHLLRPTWHLVSSDDIYCFLELTSPRLKNTSKSRLKELELTEDILRKCYAIIEKELPNENHLTREELASLFGKAKIPTNDNRLSHIMFFAEMEGIVCSGATKGTKQTYALLSERVQKNCTLLKEESLAKLARKYFSSHCPASLQDFTWWSGLSVSDAKHALEMVKSEFISESVGLETYWLTNSFSIPKNETPTVHLLPAFDEFLISYKDRTASLLTENNKRTVSNNGIFYPIIVINGQVSGLWKRTIKKDTVTVEVKLFEPADPVIQHLINEKIETFGSFLGKEIKIVT